MNDKIKCPECNKEFTKKGIKSHIWRVHTEEGRNFKPFKDKEPWNKGLTKETDKRIKQSVENSPKHKEGHPISEETKKLISEKRKAYLKKYPEKVPFAILNNQEDNKLEKIFEDELIKNNISCYKRNYPFGKYKYDFAFIDLKIDVEIDGNIHNKESVKEKDKIRDEFSNSMDWVVLRFNETQILNFLDDCILKLKDLMIQRYIDLPVNIDYDFLDKEIKYKNKIATDILNNEQINKRIDLIKNSNINFQKLGWVGKTADLLNISHTEVRRFMKKYMIDFYNNCYHRNN